jgi:glycosyltransferase involved in cell wall biosynthesis
LRDVNSNPVPAAPDFSVVVPVYNEEKGLDALVARLVPVMEKLGSFEIILVDDGSRDGTLGALRRLCAADARLSGLSFSRNFGKEIAISAGLDQARGRAVIIVDADLQHPPETIPDFVAKWREGFHNVYGVRRDRENESALRRAFARAFYRLFARFAETELPPGAGDFRLLDRRAVDVLKALPERARFSKGLYAWVGFKAAGVSYDVSERAHGESKWSFRKLLRFALDGITSFSTVPLRLSIYLGALASFFALAYAIGFLIRTLIWGIDVPGFPSLIVSVMFFSGVQLIFLGVIGEYVGRIFEEVKRRPLYVVGERIGLAENLPDATAKTPPAL